MCEKLNRGFCCLCLENHNVTPQQRLWLKLSTCQEGNLQSVLGEALHLWAEPCSLNSTRSLISVKVFIYTWDLVRHPESEETYAVILVSEPFYDLAIQLFYRETVWKLVEQKGMSEKSTIKAEAWEAIVQPLIKRRDTLWSCKERFLTDSL